MKFSEKRTLEKRKKFVKELRTELSSWGSARLKNATANFVPYLNGEGTPEHFVKFILAAKFGDENGYVAIDTAKLRNKLNHSSVFCFESYFRT